MVRRNFYMQETPFGYANISESDVVGNKEIYCRLLKSALFKRATDRNASDFTSMDALVTHIIDWLNSTDFFIAPASLKYHDAFEGGLMYHCLCVYNKMLELIKLPSFESVDIASATLIALTHDWCKIGLYGTYFKNVKDDSGNWVQQLNYKYDESHMGLGHSTQSLVMLMQLCNNKYTKLTFDEMAAIKWHMYTWDMTQYDQEDFNRCNNHIPLVKLIQFADQLACADF